MIPLRILHAVPPAGSPESLGVEPLLAALTSAGQSVATLARAGTAASGSYPRLVCDPSWFRWLTRERKRTAQEIALWAPDLIHVHATTLLPAALDLSRDLGLNLVVSTTTHEDAHATRRLRDPRITWILVPTEEHRVHLTSRVGVHRDRVAVIPPCAAPVEGGRTFRIEAGWRVGAVVGKRVDGFLAAIDELQSGGLPVEAVLHLGRLPPRARERLREKLADGHRAIALDDGPLAEFLDQLDVLAVPEPTDHLVPLVVAAQVAGIPVVTVPSPGCTELLKDGVTGLVLEDTTPAGMADALCTLHDRERRSAMATAAMLRAGSSYTAPVVAAATLNIYRASLGQSDSGIKAEVSRTWRRMTDLRLR